ncbi:SNF2 family N-terminal domain-containing protein [Cladorrhinum samala]|uniref:SNF2 family N-terminal domain-containing protein n=1 Tax=Cladorrhinum samala TaxID=585594 RepID=A0AAV9HVJ9_9PEZI|nr:SNF2 family N-terminal domain-containing protein [Cladorrhinum samala]
MKRQLEACSASEASTALWVLDNPKRPRSQPCDGEQAQDGDPNHVRVCFGAIISFEIESYTPPIHKIDVKLQPGGKLHQLLNSEYVGHLVDADDEALLNVLRQDGVDFEMSLVPNLSEPQKRRKSAAPVLWVTLYGPLEIADDLGKTLQELDLYLQDPVHSHMRLPYHNPHLFGPKEGPNLLDQLESNPTVTTETLSPVDILAQFVTSNEELEEIPGSPLLRTPLLSHQRRGLAFMSRREAGWNLFPAGLDIWSKELDAHGDTLYVNNVTNEVHRNAPPIFKGGLLGDRMGLGKTLAILALIAHDKGTKSEQPRGGNPTLIVVPPTLIHSWEEQMTLHYVKGTMKWRRHHGSHRITSHGDVISHDIIICSYPTLAREWKENRETSVIFQHIWQRVVLDEAHHIKNAASLTAKATFALKSEKRWAVTATPIQNRLTELVSLFQFLQVFPYSDKAVFESHISSLWSMGQPEQALQRLKQLLGFIMLRRSANAITLPDRHDRRVTVELDARGREQYDKARLQAIRRLDDAFFSQNTSLGFMNALSKISTLRMICNLGEIDSTIVENTEAPVRECQEALAKSDVWDQRTATAMLHEFPSLGIPYTCVNCKLNIEGSQGGPTTQIMVLLTQCLSLWCPNCVFEASSLDATADTYCTCQTACARAQVPLSPTFMSEAQPVHAIALEARRGKQYPAKIRALLADLNSIDPDIKSIVFSFWKSTLDLVKLALSDHGIECLQIDGTVSNKTRPQVLDKFRHDPNCRVLLLSLSCGAVGLNLTAASRAYLMEPQWNPAIEEQALARVHRLGQTREVTTIRFVVDKTIEQFVLELQEKKRDFSNILFSGKGSSGPLHVTKERLQELQTLLR